MPLAQLPEQYVSLGIFVLTTGLSALSFLAWRRDRQTVDCILLGRSMDD